MLAKPIPTINCRTLKLIFRAWLTVFNNLIIESGSPRDNVTSIDSGIGWFAIGSRCRAVWRWLLIFRATNKVPPQKQSAHEDG